MICVELAFTDDPRRLRARPDHRARLQQLHAGGVLLIAGPWSDDSGALLVFDAPRAAVEEAVAGDPYYATPGVTVTSIREWTPIVGTPAQQGS